MSDTERPRLRRPRMTLRVYTTTPDGTVTEERARVHVMAGDVLPPLMSHAYPPCACPRHRGN